MTTLGTTSVFYGGGQVKNPSNVIVTQGVPSDRIAANLGSLAVDNVGHNAYIAISHAGGTTDWQSIGAGGSKSFPISPYVVGIASQAGYQTIQSAIDAALAAGKGTVYVQKGTYTENLTIPLGIDLVGVAGSDSGGSVSIQGSHTIVLNRSELTFNTTGISYSTSGDLFTVTASAVVVTLQIETCEVIGSGGNSHIFNCINQGGNIYIDNIVSNNISMFTNTVVGMSLFVSNSSPIGTSGGLTDSFASLDIKNSVIFDQVLSKATSSGITGTNCLFGSNVSFEGNSSGSFKNCQLSSSDIEAVSVIDAGTTVNCVLCSFYAASGVAITGLGRAFLSCCTFPYNDDITDGSVQIYYEGMTVSQSLCAGGDKGVGDPGCTSFTSTNSTTIDAGVGTVNMSSVNNARNAAWIKIYIGVTPYWIPAWDNNAP